MGRREVTLWRTLKKCLQRLRHMIEPSAEYPLNVECPLWVESGRYDNSAGHGFLARAGDAAPCTEGPVP